METQLIANRYKLKEIVGEGSYSIVFRGFDTDNEKYVAIKELKSSGMTNEEAQEAHDLFFNELNILKSLDHRSIPKVYDFFLFEERYYLVMEWIQGKNLLEIYKSKGRFTQFEALKYMEELADVLAYMQDEGRDVVYKDIKPSNIIVSPDGTLKLIDFGTSRRYSPDKKKDTHVLGTPGYAPPEAYTETQTDFSADIYSFGATFFHLSTGKEPVDFKFKFPPPKKFNPKLSDRFSNIITDCLKSRDKRIPDAKELLKRVKGLQDSFFKYIKPDNLPQKTCSFIKQADSLMAAIFIIVPLILYFMATIITTETYHPTIMLFIYIMFVFVPGGITYWFVRKKYFG